MPLEIKTSNSYLPHILHLPLSIPLGNQHPDALSVHVPSSTYVQELCQICARLLYKMAEGKSGWEKLWAKADRLAIMADESARLSLYNGFIKKGMSPMEASLATLEAQNFTKHGYSPTIRMLSTMIPFFNSQIQGLNNFARSISGKSLFEDKLGARETMLKRGATVAGLTLAYTAMMRNTEAYKNADEYDKLNYWFIPLPFFKDPIRVPIPFEVGGIFKMLPEML
jgi:hypothetical protein